MKTLTIAPQTKLNNQNRETQTQEHDDNILNAVTYYAIGLLTIIIILSILVRSLTLMR